TRTRQSPAAGARSHRAASGRGVDAPGSRPAHADHRAHRQMAPDGRPARACQGALRRCAGFVMSDRSAHLGLADSEAISARAAEFIVEQQTGEWSEAEEAALAAWIAESSANRIAYWKLEAAWDRTRRIAALKPSRRGARLAEIGRRVWPVLSRTAAAVALVCAGGAAAFYYLHRPAQEQMYSTTVGGHETLALDDGSRIELNTDTAIRIAMTGKNRKVWLDRGEAYFDIRHDAARPFVVMAGNARHGGHHTQTRPGVEGCARLAPGRACVRRHGAFGGGSGIQPLQPQEGGRSRCAHRASAHRRHVPVDECGCVRRRRRSHSRIARSLSGQRHRDLAVRREDLISAGGIMKNLSIFKAMLTATVFAAGPALAEDFNIPAGDLGKALNAYAVQSGVMLIVSSDQIRNAHTSGLKGVLPPDEALSRLLK